MYYGGFLYEEVCRLPVVYKRWFIDRLVKELNKGGTDPDGSPTNAPSRALHQNAPDVRAMQGNVRSQTPSRLRRFTL